MSALSEAERRALETLSGVWSDHAIALIGASALRLHYGAAFPRSTEDLDLTVAIDLASFPGALAKLEGWRQDPRLEHRWYSREGVKVDVVPAGSWSGVEPGSLVWPGSGMLMSLVGLAHALRCEQRIPGTGGVRLASAAVVALLKLIAFRDRPSERARDLDDLAFLLREYVDAVDDRRFALADQEDYDSAPAFLLGRDLAAFCSPEERAHVDEFLVEAMDGGTIQAGLLRRASATWRAQPELLVAALRAARRGLLGG